MAVRLGPLEHRDRDRLHEILVATAVFLPEEIDVALELFDETSGPDDYEFVGAYSDEGRLEGYACFGPTPGTDRTYDLYWIAVHPDAQGSGAGTQLLSAVERTLGGRAARLLVVETSSRERYAPTRRFYERRGYAAAARIRDFYAPGDDRVIFTKRFP